jgi:hypothetical protein
MISVVRGLRVVIGVAAGAVLLAGCGSAPAPKIVNKYPSLPLRVVPPYLDETILQYTDMTGTEPFHVSGYGLVANLNGTGGSRAPTAVHDYISKEISRHMTGGELANAADEDPETLLRNRSFAIVRVDALVPPGARAGEDWWTWFDARVSALSESDATSLAHGDLYESDLKVGGADPTDPGGGRVQVMAQAKGPVFINPAFAFDTSDSTESRLSRRSGVVIGGARPLEDRPLILHLRTPERRLARVLEHRINEEFQDVVDDDLRVKHVAAAQDEGIIYVYVPKAYANDWGHFAGILKHLYLRGGATDYAALKAQELVEAATQPGAPLADISYAWEGLGKPALHAIEPLMSDPRPEVAYAAARAAAFIGDPGAVAALLQIAKTSSGTFRVPAVQALGQLPRSPMVDSLLRQLLDSDQALVRIEAYKTLARHSEADSTEGGPIFTHVVKCGGDERFLVDIVHCSGTPLIYASRQGIPRLAIFGDATAIDLPIMYLAMNDRFSISSDADSSELTIFYRGPELTKPVKLSSGPQLAEVVARLGGDSAPGQRHLDFSYSDVVSLVQSLAKAQKISGNVDGARQPVTFVLQESPVMEQAIEAAPLLRENGRAITSAAEPSPFRDMPASPAARPGSASAASAAAAPDATAAAPTDANQPDRSSTFSPGADVLGLDAAQGGGQH